MYKMLNIICKKFAFSFRSAMERAAVLGAPIQGDVKTDNQNIEI